MICKATLVLAAASLVAGCESQAAKLTRLETAKAAACYRSDQALKRFADRNQVVEDSIYPQGRPYISQEALRSAGFGARVDSMNAAEAARDKKLGLATLAVAADNARKECELAARDYDRFMR